MQVNSSSHQGKFLLSVILFLSLAVGLTIPTKAIQAATAATVIYDAIPNSLPPNMPSQPFQAQQTFEFGDYIHLAGTNRILRTVTFTMSDWAKYSDYSTDPRYSANSTTWSHPITVNIYNVIPASPLNQRGSLLASVTQTIAIPWRPAVDASCGTGGWRASDGTCYNGLAFNATFDLGSLNVTLPNDIIVAVAYNTFSWGAAPMGVTGPYDSLNVGAVGTAIVGTDGNTDRVFWNTITPGWYTDGGAAGVGIFREDTNWTPYGTVPIQLTAVPAPDTVYVNLAWGAVLAGHDPDGTGPATHMGYDAFTTIKAGVDAVAGGGTVNVAAGTYDEQVIINKGLTLTGAGDTTIIRPSQTTATSFTLLSRLSGGAANSASILATQTTANVSIHDLKIDGSLVTSTPSAASFMGVLYRGTPGLIDSVTVQGIAIANGNSMYLSGFGSPVTVTVTNSSLFSYNKNGITANNPGITANISGNTITGSGPTASIAQNGIQLGYGATGRINNNTITGNAWTGTYGGSNDPAVDVEADGASGVLLYLPGAGVEIDHNTLTGNQLGVWSVAAPNVNIHDNAITGLAHTGNAYPVAIAIWSEDMWTVDMGGTETGTAATIANNTISTNDYGLLVRDYTSGGAVPTVTVSGNTFNNNSTQVIATGNSVFDTVASLAGNTFDRSVTVNHLGTLVHAIWGRIQLAIGSAVAGDTVNVGAGTYIDNVVVDKALTIVGTGAAGTIVQPAVSNPNPCTGNSLCGGTASNVFLVQASNVVIHDLTVDGDNPGLTSLFNRGGANLDARNGIIKNIDATYNNLEIFNVTVRNIYLRGIYSTGGSFNFHHNNVTNVQGDEYSIAMFAWYGPGIMANNSVSYASDAISANHSNGIQFLNNVITHSASGIHTDNSGDGGGVADLIQGNTVSDCSTDGYGIWTFVPYLAPVINNNTITNCSIGLSAWGQGASVTPQFTNNTVTGPDKAAESVGAYITTDQIGYGYNNISVLFTGNIITNFETGVFLTAGAQPLPPDWVSKTINATFHLNQISGNTKGLDKGTTGTYITDFEKNWWGSATGPGTVGFGLGDTVSANVDYSPWCTNPACTTFAPPLATTTIITADSPDPSLPGQTVSVTATVEWLPGSALTPTGSVIVFEGVASGMSARSVGTYCTFTLVGGTGSCDLTFLSSGTKTITATYTPDNTADFLASSDTEGHTVSKIASQVTTWPTASSINYGQALVASVLSGGASTPAGSFAFTTPAAIPGAGSSLQSVTFTPTDTVNYSPFTSTVSVTVNKVALSVTANNASQAYNGLPYSGGNGVVYSGFVNGDTSAALGGSLIYGGTSQAATPVGSYSIVPGGLSSANYSITFHNGTLTINKASQTINFAPLAQKDLNEADFTISATASSGLPISYSTTTSTVCNVTAEGLVHLVAAGTCTIQADQSGSDNYNAAALVQRSFTVGTTIYNLYLPIIFNF